MTSFKVNGKEVTVDADPATPLVWVIREHLKLTGTKFSCGIAQCGACIVHMNGDAVYSLRHASFCGRRSGHYDDRGAI